MRPDDLMVKGYNLLDYLQKYIWWLEWHGVCSVRR
jgi:hypothetical protein